MPRSEGRQGAPEAFIAPGVGGRGTGACRGPGGRAVGRPQGAEAGDNCQAFTCCPSPMAVWPSLVGTLYSHSGGT